MVITPHRKEYMSRSNYVLDQYAPKNKNPQFFRTKQKVRFESKQEVMLRGTGSDASWHKSVIFRKLWLLYGMDSFTGSSTNHLYMIKSFEQNVVLGVNTHQNGVSSG